MRSTALDSSWSLTSDQFGAAPLLQFRPWVDAGVVHGFIGGPNQGERETLQGRYGGQICSLTQVHGAVVCDGGAVAADGSTPGDAIILGPAQEPPAIAVIRTADCVPLLFRYGSRVAAVHAGWRGLVAGVIAATLDAMEVGDGQGLECVIGPAAGGAAYDIGPEVVAALPAWAVFEPRAAGGRFGLSLAASAAAAVCARCPAATIAVAAVCTISNCQWYSYRRNAGDPGRNLAFIGAPISSSR